mgnify:CR=1 FL=1
MCIRDRPKGVVVPHRAVTRLVRDQNYLPFGPDLTFLQLSNISFDASTLELWGALLNGAKLVLQPQQKPTLQEIISTCLLYTSDAADERSSVDLGGRRIIKKKNKTQHWQSGTHSKKRSRTNK